MSEFGPATYGDSFADVYDDWYGTITDADATANFVAARAPSGSSVLELGVGTGRLVAALLAAGHSVVGIDASMKMLRICRTVAGSEQLRLVLGDLGSLPLSPASQFGAALCAFNTLFNVPDAHGQQAFFHRIAACLAPGGVLVVEALTGSTLGAGPPSSIGVSRSDADRLVLSTTVTNSEEQTIRGQHVDVKTNGEIVVRPWHLRWTNVSQLDEMACNAGLVLTERFASWNEAPFRPDSDTHISVYGLAS